MEPQLKREHPEGKHLERSRRRKPDGRYAGSGDPALGAVQHDLRSTVLEDSPNGQTLGDGTRSLALSGTSAKGLAVIVLKPTVWTLTEHIPCARYRVNAQPAQTI